MTKKISTSTIVSAVLVILLFVLVFVLEKVTNPYSMLFVVLKKGAIYALVAVSMNLLNGFTGLFSLGQAGFMLIGAYTYAIFTIPADQRMSVYQYFDGGIIDFSIPVIPALILAGIAAAFFAFLCHSFERRDGDGQKLDNNGCRDIRRDRQSE